MEECLKSPVENVSLREHQERAAKFLLKHRGLIAAFGTGTGKTLTAVAIINCFISNNPEGKIIFVCPVSLKANIIKELKKYNLSIGKPPLKSRLHIVSFATFLNEMQDEKNPLDCTNSLLIIDEAHNLRTEIKKAKDPETKDFDLSGKISAYALQCASKAKKVLLLTATPVYNSPKDIINLVAMIDGRTDPMPYDIGEKDPLLYEKILKCRITFYSQQEEKKDYPERKESIKYFEMSDDYYKKYYNIQTAEANKILEERFGDPSKYKVFYHALRRAVNDIDDNESPKIDWLVSTLKTELDKNNKSLVFSNWLNSGIFPVMRKLEKEGIKFGFISGDVKEETREKIKLSFNKGIIKILFISSAGGEGLDLIETTNVYIMESNWNVSREEQIIGRAIRYKSHINLPPEKRVVNVVRLVMKKPIKKLPKDNIPQTIDELLYDFSHKVKEPKLNTTVGFLKKAAIENNNCDEVPSNTRL
ncbi:DEAD/DEAH box helicase, partial [bacterium]|nr:DEAD/DEAH box helicase [bacterium]